jgi:hypothetical protein
VVVVVAVVVVSVIVVVVDVPVIVVVVEVVVVVVVLVSVTVVVEAVVVLVVVVVAVVDVVVHTPPTNDFGVPSHRLQTLSDVDVAAVYTYSPATHAVIAVHSRSFWPGACGFDSYSPRRHSFVVAHTVAFVEVPGSLMYSSVPHASCLTQKSTECRS